MDNLAFSDLLEKLHNLENLTTSKFEYDLDDEHNLLSEAFSNSAISGLIGKQATAKSNSVFFDGRNYCEIYFETIESSTDLEIFLSDSKGNIVFSSKISYLPMKFIWEGKDNSGNIVSAGEYFITIYYVENNQKIPDCVTNIIGKIQKMIFTKQGVFFDINRTIVPYDSIREIRI